MKNLVVYIFLIAISLSYSCKEQKNHRHMDNEELREQLIKANQIMTQNEAEEINNYIQRHDLSLIRSGSGLRYDIKVTGNSKSPDEDDSVTIEYKMNLLDGTSITSDTKETLSLKLGRAEAPKGLEEGLRMIGEGGEIYLIIPSHLAYGRTGNEINIPGNTPLVVHATLISVKKNSN
jgi:FKBP-type peptidyl-prolyl cis-trans isomerase FkpA